jgi:hypothetical protein
LAEFELHDDESDVTYELSPAAAELWASIDGRQLDELCHDICDDETTPVQVVELLRRLKALGLIEDVP